MIFLDKIFLWTAILLIAVTLTSGCCSRCSREQNESAETTHTIAPPDRSLPISEYSLELLFFQKEKLDLARQGVQNLAAAGILTIKESSQMADTDLTMQIGYKGSNDRLAEALQAIWENGGLCMCNLKWQVQPLRIIVMQTS